MDWFDLVIWYLGIALFGAIATVGLGGMIAAIVVAVSTFAPRLHAGQPNNDGELCFYDYRTIITSKDGERIEGTRQMINAPLKLKWWFGISHRRSPKWFIGIIRWEPKP